MPEFDFGFFHIEEELGRGGMAMVYKALDKRSNETIALKILYPHMLSDENSVKRFEREAKVAIRLQHPHIVPIVDFGEHDGQVYIAMKYMAGNSLSRMFEIPRAVKLKNVVGLLRQVADALDYAHQYGVIHRDLKLQNILMDDKKQAYLADFGIARLVDGTKLTATGQIAGTPMYMSPEQVRGKAIDHRSDIYSFSVMAYLMLTGYYPFTGEDALSIIHKHVKEIPPTPTKVNADLPESIDAVLLRGLLKDPEDRYQTATAMVKALAHSISNPEFHNTSTNIRIDALNPVDSMEITTPVQQIDKITSPREALNSTSTSQLPASNNRGIYAMMGLIIVLILIVGGIALAALSGNGNGESGENEAQELAARIAVSQAYLDLTSTTNAQQALQLQGTQTTDARQALRPTLPATWTPTVLPSATITPTVNSNPITATSPASDSNNQSNPAPSSADAIVEASDNGRLQQRPGPNQAVLKQLPRGTELQLIGRTADNRAVQVITPDGVEGWIDAQQLRINIDINSLPMTFTPQGQVPRNNSGG